MDRKRKPTRDKRAALKQTTIAVGVLHKLGLKNSAFPKGKSRTIAMSGSLASAE